MGFILKIILFLIIGTVAGVFVINQIPSLKQKAIEVINPAARQARILGELTSNLDKLDQSISQASTSQTITDSKKQIKTSQELLSQSQALLKEAVETNSKDGIVSATIGKLLETFTDQTPFPADHLTPVANSTTTQTIICATPPPAGAAPAGGQGSTPKK